MIICKSYKWNNNTWQASQENHIGEKHFLNNSLFSLIIGIDLLFRYKLNIRKKHIFIFQDKMPVKYFNNLLYKFDLLLNWVDFKWSFLNTNNSLPIETPIFWLFYTTSNSSLHNASIYHSPTYPPSRKISYFPGSPRTYKWQI